MVRSVSSIIIRFSYIAVLSLDCLDRRRTAGFSSTRLPVCQPPFIPCRGMLSPSVPSPMQYSPCVTKQRVERSFWYYRTRRILFASYISSYGNGNQTSLDNKESFNRSKSLFHAGGRGRKYVGKVKKKPSRIRPIAIGALLAFAVFIFLRLFTNITFGTPNYVYYARSVKESTTITSSGKVVRELEEDFRSNIPGISGKNLHSRSEFPNYDRVLDSPSLNSMRLQQEGLKQLMDQQRLEMQEEMKEMTESFWR